MQNDLNLDVLRLVASDLKKQHAVQRQQVRDRVAVLREFASARRPPIVPHEVYKVWVDEYTRLMDLTFAETVLYEDLSRDCGALASSCTLLDEDMR